MLNFKTRNDILLHFPKGMCIAELGVFKGDFSKIIYDTCKPSKLYLVDLYDGVFTSGDKDGKNYQTVNLEEEMHNIIMHFSNSPEVKVVKSSTTDFLKSIEDEHLDLVYIDADHSYNGVSSDLKLSYPKVKTGGFICGHDYITNTQCLNAVNDFCNDNNLTIDYITTDDGCPSFCITKK